MEPGYGSYSERVERVPYMARKCWTSRSVASRSLAVNDPALCAPSLGLLDSLCSMRLLAFHTEPELFNTIENKFTNVNVEYCDFL